jgi:hypothetical protein
MLSVGVRVSGKNKTQVAFTEDASTLVVSAHGGMIAMKEQVNVGDTMMVKNSNTSDEISCRVLNVEHGTNGVHEVGIEFAQSSPQFWHVHFPPPDWTPRSPEAKRFGGNSDASERSGASAAALEESSAKVKHNR